MFVRRSAADHRGRVYPPGSSGRRNIGGQLSGLRPRLVAQCLDR